MFLVFTFVFSGTHLCNLCVDTRWLAHVLRDRPDRRVCLLVVSRRKKQKSQSVRESKMNIACHHHHVCTVQKHAVLRVQPHPFANLAQVPLFPAVSQSTLLIMDSFVASVDETPTTPEVQEAMVIALVGAGFTNPEHLVETADSVIGELAGWLAGPAGGLLKRTFRCAAQGRWRWHPPHSRATWCPKSRAPWLLGHCSASLGQRHQPGQWRAP